MASKVLIIIEDDLDGTEAAETITFGLDGISYEIDLNEVHAKEMREGLAAYISAGRKTTKGRAPKRKTLNQQYDEAHGIKSGPTPKEIRAWGQEHGYNVPERGRVPAEVEEAYNAAHAITDAPKSHGGGRKRRGAATMDEIEAAKADA